MAGDGTYDYIMKSGCMELQKATFSPHKNRNLIKIFHLTTMDGLSIDVTFTKHSQLQSVLGHLEDTFVSILRKK